MWKPSAALIVPVRDLICLGLGVWGVVTEELKPAPDLGRMGFFALLMLAPGALAARWLTKPDTGGQSSLSPLEPPSPSSSSPGGST